MHDRNGIRATDILNTDTSGYAVSVESLDVKN